MKLYCPSNHYDKKYRSHLFPLLKPFFKNKGFTDDERVKLYGVSENDFKFTDAIGQADIVILPMSWNYYLVTKQLHKVEKLIEEAEVLHKKVIIIITGDYGVAIPNFRNIIVLRTSGYRTKLNKFHCGTPVFIDDPMKRMYKTTVVEQNYAVNPVIGFCGQTNTSLSNALKELLKVIYRNILFYLKVNNQLPQHIQSTTFNRSRVLNVVKNSKTLRANFIERRKYRAGVVSKEAREKTELEFYDNMLGSNYVICIRGAGNFSVRLYETLAMGRIPVFINTDCLLPLPMDIDWSKHSVWIEFNELYKLEEKIIEFHNSFSEEEFKRLQLSNRKVWEEKLTLKGFFKSFLNTIEQ
jgi:hypothetical protein